MLPLDYEKPPPSELFASLEAMRALVIYMDAIFVDVLTKEIFVSYNGKKFSVNNGDSEVFKSLAIVADYIEGMDAGQKQKISKILKEKKYGTLLEEFYKCNIHCNLYNERNVSEIGIIVAILLKRIEEMQEEIKDIKELENLEIEFIY